MGYRITKVLACYDSFLILQWSKYVRKSTKVKTKFIVDNGYWACKLPLQYNPGTRSYSDAHGKTGSWNDDLRILSPNYLAMLNILGVKLVVQ